MHANSHSTIGDLLVRDLPRDLVLSILEALDVGAEHAYRDVRTKNPGHVAAALGQMRWINMNEEFWRALHMHGCHPLPIKSNRLVIGQSGNFRISRMNCRHGEWEKAKRSQTRLNLAQGNYDLECLVTGDIFDKDFDPSKSCVFFISSFASTFSESSKYSIGTYIAVPDHSISNWLFHEPINRFLARYNEASQQNQPDQAKPTLKKQKKQSGESDESGKT